MPRFFIDASDVYAEEDACLIRITGVFFLTAAGTEKDACEEKQDVYAYVLGECCTNHFYLHFSVIHCTRASFLSLSS